MRDYALITDQQLEARIKYYADSEHDHDIQVCDAMRELKDIRKARDYAVNELLAMPLVGSGLKWTVTNVVAVMNNPDSFPYGATTLMPSQATARTDRDSDNG